MNHKRNVVLLLLISFIAASILAVSPVLAIPTTWHVSTSGNDGPPGDGSSEHPWKTIQYAVNHAGLGDTINVAAGVYDEQVEIGFGPLRIDGAGPSTIIQPSGPATLWKGGGGFVWNIAGGTFAGYKLVPIVLVQLAGGGVTIENLKVDGTHVNDAPGIQSFFGSGNVWPVGIVYGESVGTVEGVSVANMNTTVSIGRSYGIWLDAVTYASSVVVSTGTVTGYYRNGITATGAKLTFDIYNNVVTGPGTLGPTQLPNGIVICDGSTGTIRSNTVLNNHYNGNPPTYTWLSYGIMDYNSHGLTIDGNIVHGNDGGITPTTSDDISNNQIYNCTWGIELEASADDNTIHGNNIYNNTYGIHLLGNMSAYYTGPGDVPGTHNSAHNNNICNNTVGVRDDDWNSTSPVPVFNATGNWWGSTNGPGTGGSNPVSNYVDGSLYLTSPVPSLYINPTPVNKAPSDGGTSFAEAVTLSNFTNLMGFDINLTWDNSLITFVSVDYTTTLNTLWGTNPGKWYASFENSGAGFYDLAAASISAARNNTGASVLFNVTFRVAASWTFPLSTPIHFDVIKLSDNAAQAIPAIVTDGRYTMSAMVPGLELKVEKWNKTTHAWYNVTTGPPYKFGPPENFHVNVYATNVGSLTDYNLTINFNDTAVVAFNYVYWGILGPGNVRYTAGANVIVVNGSGSAWTGSEGLLAKLNFTVTPHIWKNGSPNTPGLSISITNATLSFGSLGTIPMSGITVPSALTIEVDFIRGDVDCNGAVTMVDISAVAYYYDRTSTDPIWSSTIMKYDLNNDNIIDIYDIVTIATNYGYGT